MLWTHTDLTSAVHTLVAFLDFRWAGKPSKTLFDFWKFALSVSAMPCLQVAVALLSKMEQTDATLGQTAARFATDLFERWAIGDSECNNGVLLLLSKQDRQVWLPFRPVYKSFRLVHLGRHKDKQHLDISKPIWACRCTSGLGSRP